MEHPFTIGQKLELIYKGQYLKAVIISLGSQSDNRKDGYFYARLSNGKRKLYSYDLNRVNWACNVIEYNEPEKMKYNQQHLQDIERTRFIANEMFNEVAVKFQNGDNIKDLKRFLDCIIEDTNTLKETLIESIED